jgi:hypothetical protein
MAIDTKLIDELLTDYKKSEDVIGRRGGSQRDLRAADRRQAPDPLRRLRRQEA